MQLPKVKQSTKKQLNKMKIKLAKSVSYFFLVLFASYGVNKMLENGRIQETAQHVLTLVVVLSLVFIITLQED